MFLNLNRSMALAISICSILFGEGSAVNFYVDHSKKSKFSSIQQAINEAHQAGGGLVRVGRGNYYENLTLLDGVDLWGDVGIADSKTCVINGSHSPPTKGAVTIRNIFLENTNDIIKSEDKGLATLILVDCAISVQDGYTFNLPNWGGAIIGFDLGEIGSRDNGGIRNFANARVFLTTLTMGSGSKNLMILSGQTEIYGCVIDSPVNFAGNASGLVAGASLFQNTLLFSEGSSINMYNSSVVSNNKPGIVYNSSNDSLFAQVAIDSHATLAVEGNGKGVMEASNLLLIHSQKVSPSVNIKSTGAFWSNETD